MRGRRRVIALVLLILAAAATLSLRSLTSARGIVTTRARSIPAVLAGWQGVDLSVSAREVELLRTTDYIYRAYRSGDRRVHLLATWSANDLEAVHPSDDCYTAAGWEITGWEGATLQVPGYGPLPVILKRVTKGERTLLFFDLFRTRGGWSRDVWTHLAALVGRSLVHRDPQGGKVRLDTEVVAGDLQAAVAGLEAFLGTWLPAIERSLQ